MDTIGSNWVWPREISAHQGGYRTRLLVCPSMELHQTHADMVQKAKPLKHTNVVERELSCAMLC